MTRTYVALAIAGTALVGFFIAEVRYLVRGARERQDRVPDRDRG